MVCTFWQIYKQTGRQVGNTSYCDYVCPAGIWAVLSGVECVHHHHINMPLQCCKGDAHARVHITSTSAFAIPKSPPVQLAHSYPAAPQQTCSWADPEQWLITANIPVRRAKFTGVSLSKPQVHVIVVVASTWPHASRLRHEETPYAEAQYLDCYSERAGT